MFDTFHPDLRRARLLPRAAVGPRSLHLIRAGSKLVGSRDTDVVAVDEDVSVRVFRPGPEVQHPAPAVLYIHGGGYVMGTAAMGDAFCSRLARHLDVVVASVDYRLAPEHAFPTPLEDCYAGLQWLAERPDVDAGRIAIVGESAGGGLGAALALLARDRADIRPAAQVLSYPMLDDRTATSTDEHPSRRRLWNADSNRFGWDAYLGRLAGGAVPALAAPARAQDLSDLAPAWIGVGTHDLFHDEDVTYTDRLRDARVACDLMVVPGAYHGFDGVEPRAGVSRDFLRARLSALAAALA